MPLVAQNPKPRVILGLMTIGPDVDGGARITTPAEYKDILDHFQGQGYHEVDTARNYVNFKQEAFTASIGWQDRGLTLATKCYPNSPGEHSPARLHASLEKSLGELQAGRVDLFYLHAADRSVPFETTLAEVDRLHREGKFVRLGLSNFTAFEVAEVVLLCRQHGWVRPTVYQGMYNAITRSIDPELVAACRRYGLDIVIYNPLAGGIFSGKYKSADVPASGRFGSDNGTMGQRYRERYFRDATFDALRIIEPAVAKHGLSLVETAMRWCVHHSALKIKDGNDGIIIGVSSKQQLEDNLAHVEKGPLPDDVVAALDEAWLVTKPTTPNYWHLKLEYTYDPKQALFG